MITEWIFYTAFTTKFKNMLKKPQSVDLLRKMWYHNKENIENSVQYKIFIIKELK